MINDLAFLYLDLPKFNTTPDLIKRLEKIMPTHIPLGSYDGLYIEDVLKWEPKTAIVQDTSVLHAPAGFNELDCKWKLGITFHIMKKDPDYNNSIKGYYTPWSRYTQPMIKND